MDDIEEIMSVLDRPVRLPAGLRASLAEALAADAEPLLVGLDAPRPLPAHLRSRLARTLSAPTTRLPQRWLAVAAAVILIAGGAATVLRGGGSSPRTSASSAAGGSVALGAPSVPATPGAASSAAGGAASGTPPTSPADNSKAFGTGGAASTSGGTSVETGAPPPFATAGGAASMPQAALPAAAPPGPAAAASPRPSVITIAAVGDNPGFDAYIALLNQQGGINGSHVEIMRTTPQHPAASNAVAIVNLTDTAISSPAGPVLETLAVPDGILRGSVFDVASAPAHQAVVAVDTVFPRAASGQVAIVYRGTSGVWADDVPNAMVAALRQRGVTPLVMTYAAGQRLTAAPANAAFLALDTATARAWFAEAGRTGSHPRVAGLGSLVEPSVVAAVPEGTVAVGPYVFPKGAELDAIAAAIGTPPGTIAVHGWVTAKVLAVALWRSHAMTAADARAALSAMGGFDDGFAPPLAFRSGTNSRVPDGTVFVVHNHALTGTGAFTRDPA